MNAIPMMLSAVPVLVTGYALLVAAALAGAMVLARDSAHLFLSSDRSQRVLHQQQYVTSMVPAVTSLIGVLVMFLIMAVALAVGVTVVVSLL